MDVAERCRGDPTYGLGVRDIAEWEGRYGGIPHGALVCMRSGFDERFEKGGGRGEGGGDEYCNAMRFPGWSAEAARYLVERGEGDSIVGIGVDTLSTDVGTDESFPVHNIVLGAGLYQVENLNLRNVPVVGCTVVVAPLRIRGAPESPARVIAFYR